MIIKLIINYDVELNILNVEKNNNGYEYLCLIFVKYDLILWKDV